MRQSRIYTKELLENAVDNCLSFSDVCRYLNKYPKGATYELIKNRIKDYEIDTSHFLGKSFLSGKRNPSYNKRYSKELILTKNKKYRVSHNKLKRALEESNIEYKCSICLLSKWLDKKITLDIDHINGDWSNCELENLRFICPNCHRQTDTFGSKNRKGAIAEID